MDGVDVSRLLELIDDYAGVGKKDIGRIDLKGAYSFFEVDNSRVDDVMKGINGITYKGRPVRVELTDTKDSESKRSSGGRAKTDSHGSRERSSARGSSKRERDSKRKWR